MIVLCLTCWLERPAPKIRSQKTLELFKSHYKLGAKAPLTLLMQHHTIKQCRFYNKSPIENDLKLTLMMLYKCTYYFYLYY